MKQNKSKGIKQREAEGGRSGRWLREGGKERKREMDEPNYPPIFLHNAEPHSKRRAEKEKVNNRNVSNDGGR